MPLCISVWFTTSQEKIEPDPVLEESPVENLHKPTVKPSELGIKNKIGVFYPENEWELSAHEGRRDSDVQNPLLHRRTEDRMCPNLTPHVTSQLLLSPGWLHCICLPFLFESDPFMTVLEPGSCCCHLSLLTHWESKHVCLMPAEPALSASEPPLKPPAHFYSLLDFHPEWQYPFVQSMCSLCLSYIKKMTIHYY